MNFLKLAVMIALTTFVLYMVANCRNIEKMTPSIMESDGTKPDFHIVQIYNEVLLRQPTPEELSTQRLAITTGMKNLNGLRRELRDSDEYVRMLKTQSNALLPELPKLINDKDVFDLIAYMYKVERKKDMPREMMLPLRDIYVYLSYNNARFRAFLRLHNYEELEAAIRRDPSFDKADLMNWIEENVDDSELEKLTRAVEAEIAERNKAAALNAGKTAFPTSAGLMTGGPSSCPSSGLENQMPEFISYMQSKCESNKENEIDCDDDKKRSCKYYKAAQGGTKSIDKEEKPPVKKLYLPTHEGNMVLRPEFAWRVPEQRPPVCTTLGGKTPVSPMMANSTLLLGTPLNESRNTEIGSILPKFEHKRYIDVPETVPNKAACDAIKNP